MRAGRSEVRGGRAAGELHRWTKSGISTTAEGLSPLRASTRRYDVLVVGGGPAGAATGYWLAQPGHDVRVVESKTFPREKTCGDGLTPRAVQQLARHGPRPTSSTHFHRYDGLRAIAHGSRSSSRGPSTPSTRRYGYVVRRRDLDQIVAEQRREGRGHPLPGHRGASRR